MPMDKSDAHILCFFVVMWLTSMFSGLAVNVGQLNRLFFANSPDEETNKTVSLDD